MSFDLKDALDPIIYSIFTFLALWLKDYKKRKEDSKGLNHTADRLFKCKPILHEIKNELEADRVQLWDGSNGTTSLSGYHIQRLSIFAESNREGLPDIGHKLENIPSQKMERNLLRLADSDDGYVISYEKEEVDDLARINQSYNINTALLIRIESVKKGWVGMLIIGWSKDKLLSNYEISFAKIKASQLGAIDRI